MYTSYFTTYLDYFTIIYMTAAPSGGGITLTEIIALIISLAAIIVVALLFTFVIRIQKNRRMADGTAISSSERVVEAPNAFDAGLPSSGIEEDPFAEDFKEDKFLPQI